ncbi:hypothetical protein KK083_00845 [Fulvivirgaceae bacterium PWU4]|uniref:Uncharacterized protein n=1 Tax=Chryseosolibacter histidini TaxID=2782349 RepID=A0AAP2DFE4_9BACT|nr:hypothetical protein [Chryseosolibacter histidini]MBT1695401.1 hypothetical protein [Chryseosolibacter histidini]
MHVDQYLSHVREAEENLGLGLKKIMRQHSFETDVVEMCERFVRWSDEHKASLEMFNAEDNTNEEESPGLFKALFANMRIGPYGLLRDLHALSLLIHDAHTSWTILQQGAMAQRNTRLELVCKEALAHLNKESMWVETRIKNAAPQILIVG